MAYFPALATDLKTVMTGQSHNTTALVNRIWRITGWPIVNVARGGLGWDALIDSYLSEMTSQATTDRTILVMNGGQGDILEQVGRTSADCYALATTYAAAARTAGYWKVIGVAWPDIAPGFYPGRPTPEEEIVWAEVQALTAANTGGIYDDVVRCDTAPLNDATSLTYFNADRLHLVENGEAVMGDRIGAKLLTVSAS